jgi:aryl-alcohol dehydrogenase-like predicted oxidoreductase
MRRPLGSTDMHIHPLGIGSIGLHHGEDVVLRQMNLLLEQGANLIDTAQYYPGSEAFIGKHFSHRRDEYYLVTRGSLITSTP